MVKNFISTYISKTYDELTQKQKDEIIDILKNDYSIMFGFEDERNFIYNKSKNDIRNHHNNCGYAVSIDKWQESSHGSYDIRFVADNPKGDIEIRCSLNGIKAVFFIPGEIYFMNKFSKSPMDFVYDYCDINITDDTTNKYIVNGKQYTTIYDLQDISKKLYVNIPEIKTTINNIYRCINDAVNAYLDLINQYVSDDLYSIEDYLLFIMPDLEYTFEVDGDIEEYIEYNFT